MRPIAASLLLLTALAPAWGEEATTAADTSETGRSLERILDIVLAGEPGPTGESRTILVLLDATPSLQTAGFAAAFESALLRQQDRLQGVAFAVARVGAEDPLLLPPTRDLGRVVETATEAVSNPETSFQNVYAEVRRMASFLRRRGGRRDLLLVTLENGDLEDDVEDTASAVERAGVRLWIVAREAFLSDPYHVWRSTAEPRGAELHGPDGAFVEIPWGYLFQYGPTQSAVPSGFPFFGLSRLAAQTQGRVFLYYPESAIRHQCHSWYGACTFCTGDHLPQDEAYQPHRLRALAPEVSSRREAMAAAARDPFFRAVLEAWGRAAKEGLVLSRPSVKRVGATLRPERRPPGQVLRLGSTTAFGSEAARASRAVRACEGILRDLEEDLAAARERGEGSVRYRAVAETTEMMLRLTRLNLLYFIAFCREVGPELEDRDADDVEPPEIPGRVERARATAIGRWPMPLCHGVGVFRELHLPGGEEMEQELLAFERRAEAFFERYAHTPFARVVRQAEIARFSLTFHGRPGEEPERRIPGTVTEDPTTPSDAPGRPARTAPSTGTGDGPTTGGG